MDFKGRCAFSSRLDQEKYVKDISLVGQRKRESKTASPSQASALYAYASAHRLRQRLGDRQTNARAAEGARTRFVNTIEAFEDVRELLLSKTHAGIGDAEGHRVLPGAGV